jgi:hypothetical protein
MTEATPIELRLEIHAEGPLPPHLAVQISKMLSEWWPEAWDVKIPEETSLEHPAEWRAVVPLPEGMTPEKLHLRVDAGISALDGSGSLHYRTRWSFHQAPNHQEVYEVRWNPEDS